MNKEYTETDIIAMEQRYRATFINSLSGYKNIVLIGTKSANGNENLAIFNSLIHLGANPALCGFIVRPDVTPRHTLRNILDTRSYTINHIHSGIYRNAHQTSAKYPDGQSEFIATGLAPTYSNGVYAPYVAESNTRFACTFEQRIDLAINGTILVIGKIIHISVPDTCLAQDGYINHANIDNMVGGGLDGYYQATSLSRLTYAKVGEELREIQDLNY